MGHGNRIPNETKSKARAEDPLLLFGHLVIVFC